MLTQNMNIRLLLFLMIILNNQIFAQSSRSVSMQNDTKSSSLGKYHAIIISENQYLDEKIHDLTDPKNDADKLTLILISKYFFNQLNFIRIIILSIEHPEPRSF